MQSHDQIDWGLVGATAAAVPAKEGGEVVALKAHPFLNPPCSSILPARLKRLLVKINNCHPSDLWEGSGDVNGQVAPPTPDINNVPVRGALPADFILRCHHRSDPTDDPLDLWPLLAFEVTHPPAQLGGQGRSSVGIKVEGQRGAFFPPHLLLVLIIPISIRIHTHWHPQVWMSLSQGPVQPVENLHLLPARVRGTMPPSTVPMGAPELSLVVKSLEPANPPGGVVTRPPDLGPFFGTTAVFFLLLWCLASSSSGGSADLFDLLPCRAKD